MNELIIIAGDLHGDWKSLNSLMRTEKPRLVLQCGDFGWWPQRDVEGLKLQQRKWSLKGLNVPQDSLIHWCDGNHENHEMLDEMTDGSDAPVHCHERVVYQPRGSKITLPDGRVVLFAGGGESIDRYRRIPGYDWFDRELPNRDEYKRAISHDSVDIVISHTCPKEIFPNRLHAEKAKDPTREWLSEILHHYNPALWYFGHWHIERSGTINNTSWQALDYPNHGTGGRWWVELPPY